MHTTYVTVIDPGIAVMLSTVSGVRTDMMILHIIFTEWWRHDMETPSTLLVFCEGGLLVPSFSHVGGGAVIMIFDALFIVSLNKYCWTNSRNSSDFRHHDTQVTWL